MADGVESSVPVIAVTAAVGAVVLLFVLLCNTFKKEKDTKDKDVNPEDETETADQSNGKVKKPVQHKRSKNVIPRKHKDTKVSFNHPWLVRSLKSHSNPVLDMDFSTNGKYLATCGEDRCIYLWSVKDFTQKEFRSIRCNVEYDHATRVKFSPDSKAILASIYIENTLRLFKLSKKSDGAGVKVESGFDFPKRHTAEIINIGIASSGKFIMTYSSDTTITIWDLKGDVLATIDTNQMNNSYGAVSPCGRFVASAGFTSDVKVWEVSFDKSGNFKGVVRAFELKGHSAGVYCFDFNSDSTRMASVSKDGTWKLWDTNVEYAKDQDPHLMQTGKYDHKGASLIGVSPDGRAVAVSSGLTVGVFNALTGELLANLEDMFTGSLTSIKFDISNRYLAIAGDRQVIVFHNVVGYQAAIEDLGNKIKKASGAHKDRLQLQMDEARQKLKAIESGAEGDK